MRSKEFIAEAKEIKTEKPRNFVAKNAKMGGAGAHKDKKKAEKQGDVKHKQKAFAEENESVNIPEMQKQLAELQNRQEVLRNAVEEARKITTEIKYDDTAMTIVNRIQELAGKTEISEQEIKWAVNEVMEKARELESAVYKLDDAFTDAYREIKYKAEELEYEIDDYQNEQRRSGE